MSDLGEIAAKGGTAHLFNEVSLAEVPATVPVFPKPGTYSHPTYGDISFTPERIANFVQGFKSAIYQKHIPIDAEHETKLSGALGYINDLVVNGDGSVDAAVDWTDRGRSLVTNDRFKYVSPEWYDRWEQPDTNVEFQDVLVGLALTTRPFLKDANGALRPLVAREGELIAPPETQEGEAHVTDPTTGATETDPTKGKAMTENESTQLSEEATKQFRELSDKVADLTTKFTEADTARQAAESRVTSLEADKTERELTDKVKAFSMPADEAHHVDMLKALPADKHDAYIAKEKASTDLVKSRLLNEPLGTDARALSGSAEEKIDAKAKLLREANPALTEAQAFTEAMNANRDLARQMVTERGN